MLRKYLENKSNEIETRLRSVMSSMIANPNEFTFIPFNNEHLSQEETKLLSEMFSRTVHAGYRKYGSDDEDTTYQIVVGATNDAKIQNLKNEITKLQRLQ